MKMKTKIDVEKAVDELCARVKREKYDSVDDMREDFTRSLLKIASDAGWRAGMGAMAGADGNPPDMSGILRDDGNPHAE